MQFTPDSHEKVPACVCRCIMNGDNVCGSRVHDEIVAQSPGTRLLPCTFRATHERTLHGDVHMRRIKERDSFIAMGTTLLALS